MQRILLTGGIGSGKSTVARILQVLGVPVFEADLAGRELLAKDAGVQAAIVRRFGPEMVKADGTDRKALAAVVFNDPEALSALNAIVHPAVRSEFQRWVGEQKAPYVVMEAAIQGAGQPPFDRIVVVSAPEYVRIQRVMVRDGVEERAVRARMANQIPEEQQLAKADHVIRNDDTELVIPQVLALHAELTK